MNNKSLCMVLFGALSLAGCGLFQAPQASKPAPTGPIVDSSPEAGPDFAQQGTVPLCNSTTGAYPYSTTGPGQRQVFFLNDGNSPINYQTFTTDLPDPGNIYLEPYPVSSSGSQATAAPISYNTFYRPTLKLSGTLQNGGAQVAEAYVNANVVTGTAYMNSVKQFDVRVLQSANDYKKYLSDGTTVEKDTNGVDKVFSGAATTFLTLNGKTVRFAGNQTLKVEAYLAGNVTYQKEIIKAQYKLAGSTSVSTTHDWVVVQMPYQDFYVKATTDKYVLYDTTGPRTVLTNGQPLMLKVTVRGITHTPDPDHRFYFRKELYYSQPYGVAAGGTAEYNSWLDARKDHVLGWTIRDQKIGKVTVDGAGVASVPTEVKTLSDVNLGDPSSSNGKNCISKSVSIEQNGKFSVVQPGANILKPVTFTESQQGLKAEYFDNADFTGKRVERLDAGVNFNWGGYSPAPGINPETYSVRWSGSITPQYSEEYTFTFTGGHGVRLKINGQTITATPDSTTPQVLSGKAQLQAGQVYDLQIFYKNQIGRGDAQFEWSSASQSRQGVGVANLRPIMLNEKRIFGLLQGDSRINNQLPTDSSSMVIHNDKERVSHFSIKDSTGKGVIIGSVTENKILELFYYADSTEGGLFTNVLDGRKAVMQNINSYFNEDGSQSMEQSSTLLNSIMPIVIDKKYIYNSSTNNLSSSSAGISKQSLFFNMCGKCSKEFYEMTRAVADYNRSKIATAIVCIAAKINISLEEKCNQALKDKEKLKDTANWATAYYNVCIVNHSEVCAPKLAYTPKSINDHLPANSFKIHTITFMNLNPGSVFLELTNIKFTTDSRLRLYLIDIRSSMIVPYEFVDSISIYAECYGYDEVMQGTLEMDTNSTEVGSMHITIPISITCYRDPALYGEAKGVRLARANDITYQFESPRMVNGNHVGYDVIDTGDVYLYGNSGANYNGPHNGISGGYLFRKDAFRYSTPTGLTQEDIVAGHSNNRVSINDKLYALAMDARGAVASYASSHPGEFGAEWIQVSNLNVVYYKGFYYVIGDLFYKRKVYTL